VVSPPSTELLRRLEIRELQVRFVDSVNRRGCLRGVHALAGLAARVWVGVCYRFTESSMGASAELVPSEYSWDNVRVQG